MHVLHITSRTLAMIKPDAVSQMGMSWFYSFNPCCYKYLLSSENMWRFSWWDSWGKILGVFRLLDKVIHLFMILRSTLAKLAWDKWGARFKEFFSCLVKSMGKEKILSPTQNHTSVLDCMLLCISLSHRDSLQIWKAITRSMCDIHLAHCWDQNFQKHHVHK